MVQVNPKHTSTHVRIKAEEAEGGSSELGSKRPFAVFFFHYDEAVIGCWEDCCGGGAGATEAAAPVTGPEAEGLVVEVVVGVVATLPLLLLLLLGLIILCELPALLLLLFDDAPVAVLADAEGEVGALVVVQFSITAAGSSLDAGEGEFEFTVAGVTDLQTSAALLRSLVGVVDVAPGAVGVECGEKSSLAWSLAAKALDEEPFAIAGPPGLPGLGVAHGDEGPFVVGTFESPEGTNIADAPPFASITDEAVVAVVLLPLPPIVVVVVVSVDSVDLFSSISIVVRGPVPQYAGDDERHLLVENVTHHQPQQALLLLHEERPVVGVFGEMQQRTGRSPQHVQARAHRIGIVAQEVDTVLVGHAKGRLFRLLDECHQDTHGDCIATVRAIELSAAARWRVSTEHSFSRREKGGVAITRSTFASVTHSLQSASRASRCGDNTAFGPSVGNGS
uniref:Uncharacterized protein n=1 Tax=Anopheles atroparvus TaxID=41427 RepID=A0A182J0T0_ANOAO